MHETWGPIPPIAPKAQVDPDARARIAARGAGVLWFSLGAFLVFTALVAAAVSVSAVAVLGPAAVTAVVVGAILFFRRPSRGAILVSIVLAVALTIVGVVALLGSNPAFAAGNAVIALVAVSVAALSALAWRRLPPVTPANRAPRHVTLPDAE